MALSDQIASLATAIGTEVKSKLSKAGGTLTDGANLILGTTTGTQIGTSTSQKLAFFGSAPVVQQGANTDLGSALASLGLRATGSTYAIATTGNIQALTGFRFGATVRTSASTLTTSSQAVNFCDASAGGFTVTLPATTSSGYYFAFKKTDSSVNTIIIAGTIDGATNYVLTAQHQAVTLMTTSVSGVFSVVATSNAPPPTNAEKIAAAPPNSTLTLTKVSGVWPGAPTTRTDITIIWAGPDPSPTTVASRTLGSAGFLTNVDLRLVY